MAVDTDIARAQARMEAERETVVAKIEAFETFIGRTVVPLVEFRGVDEAIAHVRGLAPPGQKVSRRR